MITVHLTMLEMNLSHWDLFTFYLVPVPLGQISDCPALWFMIKHPQNWSTVQCHRAARMAVDTWSCFNLHFTLFILLCTFVAYCLSFVFPTSPKFCHVLNDLVPRCPYCTFMLHFDVTGHTLYGILEDSAFTECCSKVVKLYNFRNILSINVNGKTWAKI